MLFAIEIASESLYKCKTYLKYKYWFLDGQKLSGC